MNKTLKRRIRLAKEGQAVDNKAIKTISKTWAALNVKWSRMKQEVK